MTYRQARGPLFGLRRARAAVWFQHWGSCMGLAQVQLTKSLASMALPYGYHRVCFGPCIVAMSGTP